MSLSFRLFLFFPTFSFEGILFFFLSSSFFLEIFSIREFNLFSQYFDIFYLNNFTNKWLLLTSKLCVESGLSLNKTRFQHQ